MATFSSVATASAMAAAVPSASGSPWSRSSAASPSAYPWPTARTFHAPCLRYNSTAMTADSASRPVMVYPANSVPSAPATTREGAVVAPKRAGPAGAGGRASRTATTWAASGSASRSTVSRCSAAACPGTSRPGSAGEAGWATHSGPGTLPSSSPSVAPATSGWPAETRISSRLPDSGRFCPRTSSAVIAASPLSVLVVLAVLVARVVPVARVVLVASYSLCAGPGGYRSAGPCAYDCLLLCVCQRTDWISDSRSWKVRPLAGVPMAVICQPLPTRCTFAMICAV